MHAFIVVHGQRLYNRQPNENIDRASYISNVYDDYDYEPDVQDVPVQTQRRLPPQSSNSLSNGNTNNFYQTQDNCQTRDRTLPHEKYCDHYYQLNGCSDDDGAILRFCPNGLVYTGNGRQGLIGVCDYPHRADCNGRERHSE